MKKNINLNPFIKWAGGKTQLIDEIRLRLPKDIKRYFEPFVGGGAVLFSLKHKKAFINDINSQLINTYNSIKNEADKLISLVKTFDSVSCDNEYYLFLKNVYNKKVSDNIFDVELASLFIWINKHCFNGLYRVNASGLFNVPYNNKTGINSIDEDNIRNISKYLRNVDISNLDFEEYCKRVTKGDFVYFDSPYIRVSDTSYFTSYTKTGFSLDDHKRLAKLFKKLDKKGVYLMLSNNDVELVYELYHDYNIDVIDVKRNINSKADKRTGREVIITNYERF